MNAGELLTIKVGKATISMDARDVMDIMMQQIKITSEAHTPRPGDFWPEQGGFYAGVMRGDKGQPAHHLIVSPADLGAIKEAKWGCDGKEITGADSEYDGHANTQAMAENDSELAKKILSLDINDHQDWYLGACKEARLCHINCPDQFENEWYWTSTQYSASLAYVQNFEGGDQRYDHKDYGSRARAVRRLLII